MYYNAGSFKNHVFVFDSDDSSCELISKKDLKQSGVVLQKLKYEPYNLNKLRMLYKPVVNGNMLSTFIVYYSMPVLGDNYKYDYIDVLLNLEFIPKSHINHSISYDALIRSCGYSKCDYIAFMMLCEPFKFSADIIENELLQTIRVDGHSYMLGCIVPACMIPYIFRLKQNRDLDGLLRTFGGIFSDKLYWHGISSSIECDRYKYCSDKEVTGVVCECLTQFSINLMKICVLYKFRKVDSCFIKDIVSYNIPLLSVDSNHRSSVSINLRLIIVPKDLFCLSNSMMDTDKDCVAFIDISSSLYGLNNSLNHYLTHVLVRNCGNYTGIQISCCMIPYIMKLYEKQDLDELLLSFYGIFSSRLYFSVSFSMRDCLIYRQDGDINVLTWGD